MLASLWVLALIILFLILTSAFFSSAETALTAASDARMRQLASKGNGRAAIVEELRADRDGLIGSILIGNNAVNVWDRHWPPAWPYHCLVRAGWSGQLLP